MGSRDDEPLLIVERNREIRIDTGEESLHRIDEAIEESDVTTEIDYLRAVKKIVQYGQAEWFDCSKAIDEEPPGPDTVDEEALGEELGEIEEGLPDEVIDECSDDELRELVDGIQREKEAFEKAMEVDTDGIFQDDEDGEPPAPQADAELPSDEEFYECGEVREWMPDDEE